MTDMTERKIVTEQKVEARLSWNVILRDLLFHVAAAWVYYAGMQGLEDEATVRFALKAWAVVMSAWVGFRVLLMIADPYFSKTGDAK